GLSTCCFRRIWPTFERSVPVCRMRRQTGRKPTETCLNPHSSHHHPPTRLRLLRLPATEDEVSPRPPRCGLRREGDSVIYRDSREGQTPLSCSLVRDTEPVM